MSRNQSKKLYGRIIAMKKGKTDEQIAAMWLGYGPKANLEEHGILEYRTEIEDGFIVCEEG